MFYHSLLEFKIITFPLALLPLWQLTQEWIIKTVNAVSSKVECNTITSELVSKGMVSRGVLKSGTIVRECSTGKNLMGIWKGNYKKDY